jgi:PhnB protein
MTAIPYLIANDAQQAISFYVAAFGANEHVRLSMPDGRIAHCELKIGDTRLMVADAFPEMGYRSPSDLNGSPVSILLYVYDVDVTYAAGIRAGASEVMPPSDQFDGDRRGTITDVSGHTWLIATKRENLSPMEMIQRFTAMINQPSG